MENSDKYDEALKIVKYERERLCSHMKHDDVTQAMLEALEKRQDFAPTIVKAITKDVSFWLTICGCVYAVTQLPNMSQIFNFIFRS